VTSRQRREFQWSDLQINDLLVFDNPDDAEREIRLVLSVERHEPIQGYTRVQYLQIRHGSEECVRLFTWHYQIYSTIAVIRGKRLRIFRSGKEIYQKCVGCVGVLSIDPSTVTITVTRG